MSMGTIAINYILVLFMYKEPGREPSGKKLLANVGIAFKNIGSTLVDWKYDIFLLIMGIYWAAFNQLFYSLPVFLEAWIDLDRISAFLHLAPGTITAVTITSLDSFFIIIFQMYISSVSMRLKPLNSIMSGTIILSVGLLLMFTSFNPWIVIFGILVFGIGEMSSSPKCQEYIGRIAPADKKALYMGTYFLPVGIGHLAAGWISGKPYEVIADKFYLLQKAVAEKGFDIQPVSDTFTQTQYFEKAQQLFGMDSHQLTSYLWNTYHPSNVWMIFTGLAVGAAVLLFIYDRFILNVKENRQN